MMNILVKAVVVIAIIAFVKKCGSGNSFATEFMAIVCGIFGFFKKVLLTVAEKQLGNVGFDEFNRRLNIRVHAIYDGYMNGWSYNVTNPSYLYSHNKPLSITIHLNSGLKVIATVEIKGGEILEIVEEDSPFETPKFIAPVAEAAASKPDSEVKVETEQAETDEEAVGSEKNATATEKQSEMTDVEAYNFAKSHVSDVALELNNRANEAVAEKKEAFVWIPEIQTNALILHKMAKILIDELHFKQVIIDDNKLIVFVNLDKPADDGNFDFDDSHKDETSEEKEHQEAADVKPEEPEPEEPEYDHPIIVEDDDIPDAPDAPDLEQ